MLSGVIMLMFVALVIAYVAMLCMMITSRRRYVRFVRISFITAVGDSFISRHQVQLHRCDHTWGADLANGACLGLFRGFHRPNSFEWPAFITKVGVNGHVTLH